MADEKNEERAVKGDLTDLFHTMYRDFRENVSFLFNLGATGTIAWLLFSDEEGRAFLKRLGSIVGHGAEWAGIQAKEAAERSEVWATKQYVSLRNSIIAAGMVIAMLGVGFLVVAGTVPFLGLKAVAAVLACATLFIWLHLEWARWFPLFIQIGIIAGYISTGAGTKLLASASTLPGFVFGGAKLGVETGLSWIGAVWKWLAQTIFWFVVGALYVTLVPLHQTPALLLVGMLSIPIFVIGPLAWHWESRGSHITWIMWANVIMLATFVPLAIIPEIYHWFITGQWVSLPGQAESLNARITLTVLVFALGWLAFHIVNRSRVQPAATRFSPALVAAGMYRRNSIPTWLALILVLGGLFLVAMFFGWFDKVTPTVALHVNPAINRIAGGELLPQGPEVNDAIVYSVNAPYARESKENGWVEITFPAAAGWYRTGVDVKPGQALECEVVQGQYFLSTSQHRNVPISTDGTIAGLGQVIPNQVMRQADAPEWMKKVTLWRMIAPQKPYGVMLFRYGRIHAPMVADLQRWKHQPKMLIQPEEVLLALNILQSENTPSLSHQGEITVRLRVQ